MKYEDGAVRCPWTALVYSTSSRCTVQNDGPGVKCRKLSSKVAGIVCRSDCSIYRPYQTKGFKGQPWAADILLCALTWAAAIEHDMTLAKQRGEPPALDGDPFVDAQDREISDPAITTSVAGDRALATVAFQNLDEPRTHLRSCLLSRLRVGASGLAPQGWRISDS
ncbi:MAG: hypothetical protein JSR91_24710 [Proteobacteria bacterium]|nr:hypothetical protein [Pseudomonadota bacterium]